MINRCGVGLVIVLAALLLSACDESKHEVKSMVTLTKNKMSDWQVLKKKRIVFGHQSVGHNLLEGLERLASRDGIPINISEQRLAPEKPGISHFLIGKNGDPVSKMEDFASVIEDHSSKGADVALMKLCYVDFNAITDGRQIANNYIANLDSLAQRHPGTIFVAVTAPLMEVQTGPKAWIKRLIGKQPNGHMDNARRAEFNTLLRERYLATGRLFDLARAESETTDKRCKVNIDGQEIDALCPEFTNDGGHLNEHGQEVVATAFLNLINSLVLNK